MYSGRVSGTLQLHGGDWGHERWQGFQREMDVSNKSKRGYIQIMRFFFCVFLDWELWSLNHPAIGVPHDLGKLKKKKYMILPAKTWSHVAKMDMHTNYIGIIVIILEVVWGFLDMFRKKMGSNLQRSGITSRNDGYCSWYGHWFTIQLEYYQSMKGQSHSQPCQENKARHKRTCKQIHKTDWRTNEQRIVKEWRLPEMGLVLTCVTIGTGTFLLTINMLWHALHVLASHVNLSHRRWTRQDGIQSWGSTMAQTICNGIKRTQILVPEHSGQLLQNKRYEKFLHDFLNYWWRHVGQTTLSLIRNGDSQSKQWARIVSAVRILWGNSPAACRSELLGDLDVVPQITIHCVSYWWFQTFFMFPHIWDNPSHWRTYMFQDG